MELKMKLKLEMINFYLILEMLENIVFLLKI